MGMYDLVIASCPKCASRIEFQSKAGDCSFKNHHRSEVPVEIAHDINGDKEECPSCGHICEIAIPSDTIRTVAMEIK